MNAFVGLLVSFLVITLGGVIGEQGAYPQNTVAVVGDSVTLRCAHQVRSCLQVRWQKRSSSDQVENISDGDSVYDAINYRLDISSFCDLIIEDVQLTDSGTFVCTVNGSNSGSADLIVLLAKPSCRSSCHSNTTSEYDTINFGCKLTYMGGGRPEVTWWNKKDHSEVPDVPPQILNGSIVSRDFSQRAESPQADPLECLTRFYFDALTGRASNVPGVKCETESCSILYSVRNVVTWPVLFATPGDEIVCTANGNPNPSFQWQWKEKDGDGVWTNVPGKANGRIVAFLNNDETSIQLRCVAKNRVNNQEYSKTSDYVYVDADVIVRKRGASTGAIAGGSSAGGVVAFGSIIGIIYYNFCGRG